MSIADILSRVDELAKPYRDQGEPRLPLVELTGGEPLLQRGVHQLMKELADRSFTVLLEWRASHRQG